MTRANFFASLIFSGLYALSATTSYALPEDRDQPINVQADSAEKIKEKVYYRGNVTITQGSITVKGDTVTVESANNKVQRLISDGTPAFFSQKPSNTEGMVNATANKIDYLLTNDTLILTQKANVEQTGSTIRGERIEYDIKAEHVRASGSTEGTPGRVQMTLQPDNNSPAATPSTQAERTP